jgi:hypothetical protein
MYTYIRSTFAVCVVSVCVCCVCVCGVWFLSPFQIPNLKFEKSSLIMVPLFIMPASSNYEPSRPSVVAAYDAINIQRNRLDKA